VVAFRDHFVTFGKGDADATAASLTKVEFPAGVIENLDYRRSAIPSGVPTGYLRAPGSNALAFVFQSFLDELAHAGGHDPVRFRLDLMEQAGPRKANFDAGRMSAVLREVAKRSDWERRSKTLPARTGMGVAFYFSHSGYFAEVVQATVSTSGAVKVDQIWMVGDVGSQIINPTGAHAQVTGAMLDGLGVALGQAITIDKGRVEQANFDEFKLLRINQAPPLDAYFLKTDHAPTGLGEPALPPLAPALCNAIFAATGKRVRSLPIEPALLV